MSVFIFILVSINSIVAEGLLKFVPFFLVQGLDGPTGEKGSTGSPGSIGLPGATVGENATHTRSVIRESVSTNEMLISKCLF